MVNAADEFWQSDAARLEQIELERRTGLRMPEPAKPKPVQVFPAACSVPVKHKRHAFPLAAVWVVAVVAGVALVSYAWVSQPIVTRAEFEAIQLGMTKAECVAIVGTEPSVGVASAFGSKMANVQAECFCWVNHDNSGAAVVLTNGKVSELLQIDLE